MQSFYGFLVCDYAKSEQAVKSLRNVAKLEMASLLITTLRLRLHAVMYSVETYITPITVTKESEY